MAFHLSVNGNLKQQTFKTTKDLADFVGSEYGGNLELNKVVLSCSDCRDADRKNLTSNASKSSLVCYELITNEHLIFISNRPHSISYLGSMRHCSNCDKDTMFH
jgi:hypothetical protein